ncbi:MAG: hypothetical protein JNK11_08005 [Alphaproteobacteria bacterium]|nr:hypothetical protein [Alphaproteobacteria bacterium]
MADLIERNVVFSAADTIAARGEEVTVGAVRDLLGIDDLAGILPTLQEWRIKRALAESGTDIWAGVVKSLGALAIDAQAIQSATIVAADVRARRAVEAAEQRAASAIEEVEASFNERAAEARLLKELAAEAEQKIERLEADLAKLAPVAAQLPAVAAERDAAVAREVELRKAVAEAESRQATIETALAEAQADRSRIAETAAETLETRVKVEGQIESLKDMLRRADTELATERLVAEQAKRDLDELKQKVPPTDEWIISEAELDEMPRLIAVAHGKIMQLKAERDALRAHVYDLREQLLRTSAVLDVTTKQAADTAAAAAALAAKGGGNGGNGDGGGNGGGRGDSGSNAGAGPSAGKGAKIEILRRR